MSCLTLPAARRLRGAAVLALAGLVPAVSAQTSAHMAPIAGADAAGHTWVFVDCPGGEAPLSAAATARRALRGTVPSDQLLDPACRTALGDVGAVVRAESRWLSAYSVALPTAEVAARVAALPFVRGTSPVRTLAPQRQSSAPRWPLASAAPPTALALAIDYGASRTQLDRINVPAAHTRGLSGRGVVLGWLDTEYGGFAHPAFARMVSEGRLGGTRSFAPAAQGDRHGLNTSSIAVGYVEGQLVGPAYGATLYAATTEFAPTETNAEEDAFVAGLEWLESNGVDAVNVSLGYTTFDPGQRSYTYADLNGDRAVTTRAADAAASRGVVIVASAGNDGCASPGSCWYYVGTPADGDSVIAVGATTLSGAKASFSSFGPTADGRIKPDVSAPGAGVTVAVGASGYGTTNGTSFSAPLVTGVVALMLEANPRLTPIQVRDILRATASQASAPDNRLGWGIVNADAAVARGLAAVDAARADRPGDLGAHVASNGSAAPALVFDRASAVEVADVLGRVVRREASAMRVGLDGLAPGLYTFAAREATAPGAAWTVRGTAVVGR